MSEYRAPNWRDALRVYLKALRMVFEPTFVAFVMFNFGAPWWAYVILLVVWLPLGRIRMRQLRDEWA